MNEPQSPTPGDTEPETEPTSDNTKPASRNGWFVWVRPLMLSVGVAVVVWAIGFTYHRVGSPPELEVSHDTTRLTEPLDEDGFVDYVAAISEEQQAGVTPENNAVVLLRRAAGPPGYYTPEFVNFYYEQLGIEPLPPVGNYYVSKEDAREQFDASGTEWPETVTNHEFYEQMTRAGVEPWTTEEYPNVERWLRLNKEALDLAAEASHRKRFFSPGPRRGHLLFSTEMPDVEVARTLAAALVIRGMWSLGEGRSDPAITDMLAARRLNQLTDQNYNEIAGLSAHAHLANNCMALGQLVRAPCVSLSQIRELSRTIVAEQPLRSMQFRLDTSFRQLGLDLIVNMAHGDADEILEDAVLNEVFGPAIANARHDWNRMLRAYNERCDELAEALGTEPTRERIDRVVEVVTALDSEFRALRDASRLDALARSARLLMGGSLTPEENALALAWFLLLPTDNFARAEARHEVMLRQLHVAIAIEEFHRTEGVYPASLLLLPETVDVSDPLGNGPLQYQPLEQGYLLYSAGPNGVDDNGVAPWDGMGTFLERLRSEPRGDDLRFAPVEWL